MRSCRFTCDLLAWRLAEFEALQSDRADNLHHHVFDLFFSSGCVCCRNPATVRQAQNENARKVGKDHMTLLSSSCLCE